MDSEKIKAAVEKIFSKYDLNSNGILEREEIKELLKNTKHVAGRECTEEELNTFMSAGNPRAS